MCAGQPSFRRPRHEGRPHRGGRFRPEAGGPDAGRLLQAVQDRARLGLHHRQAARAVRPGTLLAARPDARRILLDERPDVGARAPRRLRRVERAGLVLRGGPPVLPQGRAPRRLQPRRRVRHGGPDPHLGAALPEPRHRALPAGLRGTGHRPPGGAERPLQRGLLAHTRHPAQGPSLELRGRLPHTRGQAAQPHRAHLLARTPGARRGRARDRGGVRRRRRRR